MGHCFRFAYDIYCAFILWYENILIEQLLNKKVYVISFISSPLIYPILPLFRLFSELINFLQKYFSGNFQSKHSIIDNFCKVRVFGPIMCYCLIENIPLCSDAWWKWYDYCLQVWYWEYPSEEGQPPAKLYMDPGKAVRFRVVENIFKWAFVFSYLTT